MAPGWRRSRMQMARNVFALIIFLIVCLLGRSAAAAPELDPLVANDPERGYSARLHGGQTAAEKKLVHLAARSPIVTLTDGNFTRYADGKTRPYSVVVLFTALGPQYNCVSCRVIEGPFSKVAEAYSQQFDIRKTEHKVVFARIDISRGSATFSNFGVQTAPRVFLVPRRKSFPTVAEHLAEYEVTQGMSKADGDVEDFLHDLGAITGAKVVILPDSSGLLPAALLLGVVMGLVAHYFADVPSRVLAVVRHKGLWFVVSMGCYMTGVGGMVFCIIRNPKPHGYHQQTGATMMFSAGGRDQYWYEGVVVAILYLIMSAAVVGLYVSAGWKRVPSLVRTTASILCVTVLCYVASEYMALYTKKTSWYSLEQLIPPLISDFHKGPLKRKHGLLKRLVRLSHLWLNEYTGFRPFCSKLKALLWDYLVRRVDTVIGFGFFWRR